MTTLHSAARRSGGFTLIEVMVVVLILGLLAALIVPNVMQSSERAKLEKARMDCSTIVGAARMFFIDRGRVPELQELTERRNGFSYLEQIPKDPWGGDYIILADGMPPDFEVKSLGRNRSAGDEDDVSSRHSNG